MYLDNQGDKCFIGHLLDRVGCLPSFEELTTTGYVSSVGDDPEEMNGLPVNHIPGFLECLEKNYGLSEDEAKQLQNENDRKGRIGIERISRIKQTAEFLIV